MNNFNELILNNLKKAQNDYKNHLIDKNKYWQQIYNSKNSQFMNLDNLVNFRSYNVRLFSGDIALSGSITPHMNFDAHPYDTKIATYTFFVEVLMELGFEFVFNNLNIKNVGNCENSYELNGRFFDKNDLTFIHYFNDLVKFVFSKKKVKTVFEIGGGFGSLARIILNNYNCKFFSIDLPEANFLTSYYLNESLPEKKIYLYNNYLEERDEFVSSDSIKNFDIFILPPWVKFKDELKIDLFINTRSMAEMEFESIKKYFYFIHKHVSDDGFFLNINRYTKNAVGYPVNLSDYPYDDNWEVNLSKKTLNHPSIHFLLTQRKFSNFKNNIKNEIKKIKIETKKHSAIPVDVKRGFLRKLIVGMISYILKILFRRSFLRRLGYKLLSLV